MALCLINGATLRNLPYASHKNVYIATVMYGKLEKKFWYDPLIMVHASIVIEIELVRYIVIS